MKNLLLLIIFIPFYTVYSQDWNLVSRSPYEAFRFYNSANGMTAMLDEGNNTLISFHASAHSGLIVQANTPLNNINNIQTSELGYMDPDSPMRGGGFDIAKVGNDYFLFGIGTRKDECYNHLGATVFFKKITLSASSISPIQRKKINLDNYSSRDNNGVADKFGNYYFCNADNPHLQVINMFNSHSTTPVNLTVRDSLIGNKYIREFKKIEVNNTTHILGLESDLKHFIYIQVDSNGNYFSKRYSLGELFGQPSDTLTKVKFDTAFDVGIKTINNNDIAEFLFFTEKDMGATITRQIYSIVLPNNLGTSIKNQANLKFTSNLSIYAPVRGLIYIDNGSCLLVSASYNGTDNDHFYFNGNTLSMTTNKYNHTIGGMLVDKIYTSNNIGNTKVFLTRNNVNTIDSDFTQIRLYKLNNFLINGIYAYEPPLNEKLYTTNFSKGGGHRIRSLAISGNHLLYDGMAFLNYKDLNSTDELTSNLYLNLNATAMLPISENEFICGMYSGAFINRYEIINGSVIEKDTHIIDDEFKKIKSMAFDGDNVYIGLYHNGTSNQNESHIYKYNVQNDGSHTDTLTNRFITIPGTNHVSAMEVVEYPNNQKWLFGLAQNGSDSLRKRVLFRKNTNSFNSPEILTLTNNGQSLKDMEVISAINGKKYLYFISQKYEGGFLYRIDITNPSQDLLPENVEVLKEFTEEPMNLKSLFNKHLVISFSCKTVGFLTQDENSYVLPFEDMPLPTDYDHDVLLVNNSDKTLYVGTREAVHEENIGVENNDGGVYSLTLPEYLGFSYQFRHQWGIHPQQVISGDIDGNGFDDIIATTNDNGFLRWNIKLNNSNFQFEDEYSFKLGSANADFIFCGDFNGDGFDDIGVNRINDPNSVPQGEWIIYPNDGNGNFSSLTQYRYKWGEPLDKIVTGDFNGDSKEDIAIFKINNGWYIRLNNGNNSFNNNQIFYPWLNTPEAIFSDDFNGDGFDDIGIKSSVGDKEWIVRFNNQNNSFNTEKRYIWDTDYDYLLVGQYDNDGLADICINRHSNPASMGLGEWIFRRNYGYYYESDRPSPKLSRYDILENNKINNLDIEIYPNPVSNNILNIKYHIPFSYELYNQYGVIVRSDTNKSEYILNSSFMKTGIYFLKTYCEGTIRVDKIIIE